MKRILGLFLILFLGSMQLSQANLTNGYVPVTKNGSSNPPTTQNGSIFDTGTASGPGNVGIGSSTPGASLDVNGTVRATSYSSNGNLTGQTNYLAANVGIGTFTVPNALQVAGTAAMTGFQLGTSTTSGWVLTANISGVGSWAPATGGSGLWTTINTNDVYEVNSGTYGNVGIGTTLTNLAQLRILKNSTTDYVHIDSTAAGGGNLIIVNNAGNVGIGSAVPGEALDIESGNVGIGTHVAGAPLVVTGTGTIGLTTTGNIGVGTSVPSFSIEVEGGNVGIGTAANANGARMLIFGGNVGIGTGNPGVALDVQGDIRDNDFRSQASGTIMCVKTGGAMGYCSGTIVGVGCTCN